MIDNDMPVLADQEFQQFKNWIYKTAGINLTEAKKALVAGRLSKRLRHHNLNSYGEYFKLIMSNPSSGELQCALDLLTTNETYFYREPNHFAFLQEKVFPSFPRNRAFRVWSAASSSGEEPYTLAMVLASSLPSGNWEVFASDISSRVLEQAKKGHYPMSRASHIPKDILQKYCLKGTGSQEGTLLVDPSLRARVTFQNINLVEPIPKLGEFDAIFLRNVMIYFDMETKIKVVRNLLPCLRPGGYFFVSHSESLNGVTSDLKLVTPSIYQKP